MLRVWKPQVLMYAVLTYSLISDLQLLSTQHSHLPNEFCLRFFRAYPPNGFLQRCIAGGLQTSHGKVELVIN
ncbi:unnamed protein product [Rhodiola kirilowii]